MIRPHPKAAGGCAGGEKMKTANGIRVLASACCELDVSWLPENSDEAYGEV